MLIIISVIMHFIIHYYHHIYNYHYCMRHNLYCIDSLGKPGKVMDVVGDNEESSSDSSFE